VLFSLLVDEGQAMAQRSRLSGHSGASDCRGVSGVSVGTGFLQSKQPHWNATIVLTVRRGPDWDLTSHACTCHDQF